MGKLNTKYISVAISKDELLNCTDVNDHLQLQSADIFLQQFSDNTNKGTDHNIYEFHENIFSKYTSIKSGLFFLSFPKNVKFIAAGYQKVSINAVSDKSILKESGHVKKVCINPFRQMDGFKFIVKIPDKSTCTSI